MRGKVLELRASAWAWGITPAYAGKSTPAPGLPPLRWDHPRVCGEKRKDTLDYYYPQGSPPRMRGKAARPPRSSGPGGITPAYAGEKPDAATVLPSRMGSPPRMRGKAPGVCKDLERVGITPAYAGKSARRQAGPPGPAPPPQMRLGWSPPPCTGRQCRTRKSTHARRARIPVPAHTPAPQ